VEEGGGILISGTVCAMIEGKDKKISEYRQAGDVTSCFYCGINEVLTLHFSGMLCCINW
jgi:hypothetical protein